MSSTKFTPGQGRDMRPRCLQLTRVLRIAVLLAFLPGCRAEQLESDQDRFRSALLQLETNQIMDNVVRAYNGLPIVHMDYSSITGTVSQTPSGQISGSTQTTAPVTNMIAYMLGFSQTNQLTVTANPVVDKPDVYAAYLDFVGKPGRLVVSPTPPPPETAHIVRCFNGSYYWVPLEYRIDFLEMALKTSVMRGAPTAPPQSIDAKSPRLTAFKGPIRNCLPIHRSAMSIPSAPRWTEKSKMTTGPSSSRLTA
jgi:hypothetical protein